MNGQIGRIRTANLEFASGVVRGVRQDCAAAGCSHATTGRKPYCVEHLERLPYVRALVAELSCRKAELVVAGSDQALQAVDPSSPRAREIVNQIAFHGARSMERLGMDMDIPTHTTESYVRALEQAGVLEVLTLGSRRGSLRRVVALRQGKPVLRRAM
jgi:hypothetical protein